MPSARVSGLSPTEILLRLQTAEERRATVFSMDVRSERTVDAALGTAENVTTEQQLEKKASEREEIRGNYN